LTSEHDLRRAERATWGYPPSGNPAQTPEPKRARLISWKVFRKNSLRGFAVVELPIGLRIHDIPILASHNKIWASLPAKPQIDRDGQHKRDANGKPVYVPVLEWKDRDLAVRFSQAVVALVRAEYPEDLGDLP
jgi:hypothetical protein